MNAGDLALTIPLTGTQLIEASAGTGKTYTIAGIYVRLVVELRLSVSDVLVVTFTRAATDELKQRLRERLGACANIAEARLARDFADVSSADALDASTPDNVDAFAGQLIDRALASGEPLSELVRRLRIEVSSMDEAAIHTIHAFCARVLREEAFDSGEAFDAGELIGSDADLIGEIAADFWRQQATTKSLAADFDVLREKIGSADALGQVLRGLVDETIDLRPHAAHADEATQRALALAIGACIAADAALREAWCASGEADFACILAASENGQLNKTSYKPQSIRAWLDGFRRSIGQGRTPEATAIQKISSACLVAGLRKGQPPLPELALAQAVDRRLAAQAALDAARAARWPSLLHAARDRLRTELMRRKHNAARQSYDDLIVRLHAAITDPIAGARLAAALHKRFPVALIDEFQDTDARQFEIFATMQRVAADGALFLVGDPKQAIYRFRGGDIFAYLGAAAKATGRHRLERNFRSSPALLDAIEAVYAQTPPDRAFVDPRIQFHAVAAGGRAANDDVVVDGAPIVPLTLWHLPGELAGCNKDTGRAALAAGCAEAIVELLRSAREGRASIVEPKGNDARRPLAPRDIAVLVTTNNEAIVMQDALAERGVASATIRKQSIFATEEASELLTLLGALDSRNDRSLRAALASRLFGFDARALAALADPATPEPWLSELARLDALDRAWKRHGVLAMLERLFEMHAATVLAGVGGERRMTNYLQLAEWLQHESARAFGTSGLISRLRWRIANADADSEDEQLRLESDSDRVLIATVHASKGLEYNLVFLPFMALRPGKHAAMPTTLSWHEDDRRRVRVQARGDAKNEALQAAIDAADREELAERMRVLYVALTRARHAVWMSWDVVGKNSPLPALAWLWHDGSMPGTPAAVHAALNKVAALAPDHVRVATLPQASRERLAMIEATTLPPARRFDGRVDTHWWTHSFSQWREGKRVGSADENGADDEERNDAGAGIGDNVPASGAQDDVEIAISPAGKTFGTAFHEILERTDFATWRDRVGDNAPDSEAALIDATLRRHALLIPGHSGDVTARITRMIATTLNARLPGTTRLCDLSTDARRVEMPFHFAMAGARASTLIALLQRYGYQTQRVDFAQAGEVIVGLMTGVIDLVFHNDGRWWLLDYKTNALGTRGVDYQGAALAAAVASGDYDLQYLIYTVALHRWLRLRVPGYAYDRDFGGAIYLFVRGLDLDATRGVFVDRPPRALVEGIDALLAAGPAT